MTSLRTDLSSEVAAALSDLETTNACFSRRFERGRHERARLKKQLVGFHAHPQKIPIRTRRLSV